MDSVLRPAIVLPFHDPSGMLLAQLERIRPRLRTLFAHAFLSISPATVEAHGGWVAQFAQDEFFLINFNEPGTRFGDHYLAAYHSATARCSPQQVLHLCDIDKVACYLQGPDCKLFLDDLNSAGQGELPLLFQRSQKAWESYPHHYRKAERLAIQLGELLFGQTYDFAWSHLVIQAGQLADILPQVTRRDTGILAEIVLLLRQQLHTKVVDWLVWEDPFIYGRDAEKLRQERDASSTETRKRLMGIQPLMEILFRTVE
jgi:hypothetical protein